MNSGLAHHDDEHPRDGSMAVFCPAYPQTGLMIERQDIQSMSSLHGTDLIMNSAVAINSSRHSSWMVTSQQNT